MRFFCLMCSFDKIRSESDSLQLWSGHYHPDSSKITRTRFVDKSSSSWHQVDTEKLFNLSSVILRIFVRMLCTRLQHIGMRWGKWSSLGRCWAFGNSMKLFALDLLRCWTFAESETFRRKEGQAFSSKIVFPAVMCQQNCYHNTFTANQSWQILRIDLEVRLVSFRIDWVFVFHLGAHDCWLFQDIYSKLVMLALWAFNTIASCENRTEAEALWWALIA